MSQHDLKGSWGGNVLTRKQHTARVSKMERERKWKFLPVVEDVFMLREKKKKKKHSLVDGSDRNTRGTCEGINGDLSNW